MKQVQEKKVSKVSRNPSFRNQVSNASNTSFSDSVLQKINEQLQHPFFTEKANADMTLGVIPDFESLYNSFLEIKKKSKKWIRAFSFLSTIRDFSLTDSEIASLMNNPEDKHVFVHNDEIKIVLIRWEPGATTDIRGHPIGGGLIKVLHGEIQENRYSTDSEQRLLSESTYLNDHVAYIDDLMGLHSVANVQSEAAITLHIYTYGSKKL